MQELTLSLNRLESFSRNLLDVIADRRINSVGMFGELGVGKTQLVKFMLKALGYENEVPSPSYQLQNIFEIESGFSFKEVHHWDLYRLKADSDTPIEILESLEREDILTIIEWPEKVKILKDLLSVKVYISFTEDSQKRNFKIFYNA